jgi:aspartyl protease family protein
MRKAMTSPVTWSLGVLAALVAVGTLAGGHLAGRFGLSETPPEPAAARSVAPEPAAGSRSVTVAADAAGHFTVHPSVDGRRVRMLVDTGASVIALSHDDAAAIGVRPFPSDYKHRVHTANGVVMAAPVRLREVRVGEIVVRDVEALVLPAGRLGVSLLGMSFLRQLKGFEIGQGRLTLRG